MSLFNELKRRNVFRVLLAYAVAGWLLVEIMGVITGAFEAPAWVLKVFISVLVLGLVPAMIFSWVYEITPEGIRKEATEKPEHSVGTARKLDIAVLVMLTLAIGLFIQERIDSELPLVQPPVEVSSPVPVTATINRGPPMVAVLPFVATSLEGESDFFAAGVHDDLLTRLAKLQSLRVISRTSVLEYRGTTKNMREIGAELGADVILEGGVQAAGDRLRINVQLIDARSDEHLWAETYDRNLSVANIFDIQAEIARSVANALNATLTAEDSRRLESIPTQNMAAYRAYRQAMQISNVSGYEDPAFQESLEEAVRLDPEFVQAWVELVGVFAIPNVSRVTPDPELARQAEEALQRVQAIAPESADYLIAQTYYIYYVIKDFDGAHDLVSQALAMRPNDARVVMLKSYIERRQGNFIARMESIRLARQLDPRDRDLALFYVNQLLFDHRFDEALSEIELMPDSPDLTSFRALFRLRETGDIEQWLGTLKSLRAKHGETYDALRVHGRYESGLWTAYISNRDYSGALQLIEGFELDDIEHGSHVGPAVRQAIFTYWLVNDKLTLDKYLRYARTHLELDLDEAGEFGSSLHYIVMALVAAADGRSEEVARLFRRWEREADVPNLHGSKDEFCRILGMAGLAADAVQCIRIGLRQPSFVLPFLEPHLPFYDSIREAPKFVDLLAEIKENQKAQSAH